MSLSTTTNRVEYTGNGATSVYSFSFPIYLASDLVVTTAVNEVETTLVLNTDYTVSGAGSSSGGSITLLAGALASGTQLVIMRVRPLTQTTDIRNQGSFFPEIHETAFDNLTMLVQQVQEQLNRCMLLKITDPNPIGNLPEKTDRENLFLGFDSNGNPVASAAPGAVVSSFMVPVLQAASATAARTLLQVQSGTDTLTNKTWGDAPTYTQISTPSAPASGFNKFYFKSDGNPYMLNSSSVETKILSSGNVVNADIASGAAIAYSKLALSGSILNSDLAGGIAYSKLSLSGSIVNSDISSSAAIAYSKLNLATSIVNSDISTSAAIATSKLAAATAIGYLGSTASAVLGQSDAGTFTNKTFGDAPIFTEIATPSSPSAGLLKLYPKNDGNFYVQNSSGVETQVLIGSGSIGADAYINGSLAASVSGNALTIALKNPSGSDPATGAGAVQIAFRNATASNGTWSLVSVTSALSLTIPSGTTIGTVSGKGAYIYVYLMNNGGTPVLAVSLSRLNEGSVQSSSAISGGASQYALYSSSAQSSLAIRLIGRIFVSETTAGTWASGPTEISNIPFAMVNGNIRYTGYSSPSSFSSSTQIVFSTKDYDFSSAYSAGTFTAPFSGWYDILAVLFGQDNTQYDIVSLSIFKNGSQVTYQNAITPVASNNYHVSVKDTLWLNQGDTIAIYGSCGHTFTLAGNDASSKLVITGPFWR